MPKLKDRPKEKPKETKGPFILTTGSGAGDGDDAVNQLEEGYKFLDTDGPQIIRNCFPKTRSKVRKQFEDVSPKDIGFTGDTPLKEVCRKLKELGWKFGTSEDFREFCRWFPLKEGEKRLMFMSDPDDPDGGLESTDEVNTIIVGVNRNHRYICGEFNPNKECSIEVKILVYRKTA